MIGVTIGTFGGLDFKTMLVLGLLFWFVTSLAVTIPFHVQYLLRNWNTKLVVDNVSMTIEIQENGQIFKYKFSDITTERYLLGHHRPYIHKGWQTIPFDYYGYIKINTVDKKHFIVTSLMTDPFEFPLTIDATKYRFPFIEKEISEDEIRKRNEQVREGRISGFMDKFEKLPDDKLLYKLENRDKFDKDAVTAVERIMAQRKKITTANTIFAPGGVDVWFKVLLSLLRFVPGTGRSFKFPPDRK